jgi:peroxiredoxin Q/BCP
MAEVKVGDQAPEFETVNDKNEKVKLSDYRGKRVVLYFYPKDETRGCTIQACGFRDVYPQIEEKNAIVLGVSPDDAESHRGFIDHHGLPFPLLVDTDKKIAEKYDVWRERERDGVKSMGIARSHFVIDEEGKVVDVQYNVAPDASPTLSVETLAK